jgi:glycerate dehydrogenase
MGIVGFGRIGRQTATLARAFGMKVIYHDVSPAPVPPSEVQPVDLDTLFRDSDAVSLHCPLTQANRGFVNKQRLEMMKPGAFLINTSRGPLVDELALAEALNAGRIAGAGLDVLCEEPPRADNPLLGARNCYITPHIAWATRSARQRLMEIAIANVRAFLEGNPQNVVSR